MAYDNSRDPGAMHYNQPNDDTYEVVNQALHKRAATLQLARLIPWLNRKNGHAPILRLELEPKAGDTSVASDHIDGWLMRVEEVTVPAGDDGRTLDISVGRMLGTDGWIRIFIIENQRRDPDADADEPYIVFQAGPCKELGLDPKDDAFILPPETAAVHDFFIPFESYASYQDSGAEEGLRFEVEGLLESARQ